MNVVVFIEVFALVKKKKMASYLHHTATT